MDSTVEFVWSLNHGIPMHPADWAIQLLERGLESDAILRLTDRSLDWETQNQLVLYVLDDLGRSELLDPRTLRLAYESESIADYFAGNVDGWTLIRRGCDLYYEDGPDDDGRIFWIQVADDADKHAGQGICIQFPFAGNDFDQVLRDAIRNSGGPLPSIGT
ncbi:MAG: hypothetical protein J5I93_10265 [Pirellulaceae bacterium]|nr:hypothetical protein [Pirellulaceae bacterium]